MLELGQYVGIEEAPTYGSVSFDPYVEPRYAIGDKVILAETPHRVQTVTAVSYDDGFEYQLDHRGPYVFEHRLARHEDTTYTLF